MESRGRQGDEATPAPAALRATVIDGAQAGGADQPPPLLSQPALDQRAGLSRYAVHDLLGRGASGRVYRVHDGDLGRDVAVKVLDRGAAPPRVEGFLREARIAAQLEHPNIVPIHDIGATELGQVWFAMRRVDGQTLAAAITAAMAGNAPAAIARLNDRVTVMRQVCNAVQAAHARAIVHRDIKPDNIMLGAFGEVLLLDWGTACSAEAGSAAGRIGTPLYMSPEQARGEEATLACDIYSLGATLFHLLVLRPPLAAGDEPTFWRRKGAGDLDLPTAAERRRVPRHLLAIALKAMAADPAARYPSASAFAEDLTRFQAGQAISACRDSAREALARFHRRHGRRLWLVTAIIVVLVGLAAALYGERIKAIATWGAPLLVERFADESWRERWQIIDGGFAIRDGRAVTTGASASLLMYRERLSGDTAIDYDGIMLGDSLPCDLSLVWGRGYDPAVGGMDGFTDYLKIQIGAYDNSYTAVIAANEQHVAYHPFRLQPGRVHRIRIEIVADTLSLFVDGERLCRYRDRMPLTGGYFALYGYYPGKAFGDIHVHVLGTPQRVPATAIGDAFAQRREWEAAVEEYARVASSHPGIALAEEAIYKQGLCWWRAGQGDRAFATWAPLAGTRWQSEVGLHQVDALWTEGRHEEALAKLEAIAAQEDPDIHARAADCWMACVQRAYGSKADWRALLESCLAVRDRRFASDGQTDRACADALSALGRYDEVIGRFPNQRKLVARALLNLGRPEEVIERFPDQRRLRAHALADIGEYERCEREYPEFGDIALEAFLSTASWERQLERLGSSSGSGLQWQKAMAMVFCGRTEEALAMWPDDRGLRVIALPHLGRAAELDPKVDDPLPTLLCQDRLAEAAARFPTHGEPQVLLGFADWVAGDRAAAEARFAAGARLARPVDAQSLTLRVLLPYLRELAGERGAVAASSAEVLARHRYSEKQRAWHRAGYLVGTIDRERLLRQPSQPFLAAEVALLDAIRADLGGDRVAATRAFADYLALPSWQQGWRPDGLSVRIARWRLTQLQDPGAP